MNELSIQSSGTLLTIGEMAAKLRVPVSWLYSRTRQRGADSIPCVRVGKYLRFTETEVMNWIERQNQAG